MIYYHTWDRNYSRSIVKRVKGYEEFGQGSFPVNGKAIQTPEQEKIAELERKLNNAELELDILKKAIGIVCDCLMIYAF